MARLPRLKSPGYTTEINDSDPFDFQHDDACEKPFASMNTSEIVTEIVTQHNQVIELYRYLYSRAEVPSTQELLEQLTSLEEKHAMLMVHQANRLEDI